MHIATSGSKIDISKESLTAKFAKKFSKVLKHGDIVFLYGDIGAGKTTFVRYLINSLEKEKKIKLSEITSPTFSILNEYEIKDIKIRHYDLFRIKNSQEIKNIGMFENSQNFLTFIEFSISTSTFFLTFRPKILLTFLTFITKFLKFFIFKLIL